MSTLSTLAALATILLFSGFAVAQVSFPSCTVRALDWTYNSISQSPCEVVAYLESTCWQGEFTVPALPSGYHYTGPGGNGDDDPCTCNTVTYSLLSACGACQGEDWVTWSEWVINCTTVLPPSTFSNAIPSGTRVPYWATLDITPENRWNANKSMSAGYSPEIGPGELIGASGTSSPVPTGSTTQTPPATGFPTSTTSASNPLMTSPSGSGSLNISAIVGGAVGAVALLVIAIVILGIFYLRRQRDTNNGARRAMADDATIASPSMSDLPLTSTPRRLSATPWVPDVSSQVVSGPYQGSGSTLHLRPESESPPQYDNLSTVAARPSVSTLDQPRGPRLREK